MPKTIKSLWPEEINKRTLSPRAILRAQAESLAAQTGGILLGEINSKELEERRTILDFTVVVPALDGYRHRILSVGYLADFPYPAIVNATVFGEGGRRTFQMFLETGNIMRNETRADTEEEFVGLIESVLSSTSVVSAIQSLIARALEILDDPDRSAPPGSVVSISA